MLSLYSWLTKLFKSDTVRDKKVRTLTKKVYIMEKITCLIVAILFSIFLPSTSQATDYRTGLCYYSTPYEAGIKHYEERDTLHVLYGERYEAPFYLYLPNTIKGKRSIKLEKVPAYMSAEMGFNSEDRDFNLQWYDGFYSNGFFSTMVRKNVFASMWEYDNFNRDLWMGDFNFLNILEPGDTLVYKVEVEATTRSGANHLYSHTRVIVGVGVKDDAVAKAATTEAAELSTSGETLVYPNPFTDEVTVSLRERGLVKLFDLAGRLVKEAHLEPGENRLDMSYLRPGVYIIQTGKEKRKVIKL